MSATENKLLGFKLKPKSGQRIEVAPLAPAEGYIHELTNKHIKALITARKGEKASHWTIKHELQTLRGALHLARDLRYHVNLDINWPTELEDQARQAAVCDEGRGIEVIGGA